MILPVPVINQQLTDLVDSGSILPEESLAGYSIDGNDLLPLQWPYHRLGRYPVDGVAGQALLRQDRAAIHEISELLIYRGHR